MDEEVETFAEGCRSSRHGVFKVTLGVLGGENDWKSNFPVASQSRGGTSGRRGGTGNFRLGQLRAWWSRLQTMQM